MTRLLFTLFLAASMAVLYASPSAAQKKEAPKKEAAKKEVVKKESTPAPQAPGGIKEVLAQYVGKVTNLGTLKKVAGDYFVLDDDGKTVMHPLSALHTIRLSKDEESGETVIELRLFAKD